MRRREFVAGGATAALLSAIPSWAADLKQFKLGVITDEVTQDFEKALLWAKGYGLGWVELRFVWNKYVTDFTADDVTRAKELLAKHSIKVSVVDSAYFKMLLPGTQSKFGEGKSRSAAERFIGAGRDPGAGHSPGKGLWNGQGAHLLLPPRGRPERRVRPCRERTGKNGPDRQARRARPCSRP
jgi:hypothetical protein